MIDFKDQYKCDVGTLLKFLVNLSLGIKVVILITKHDKLKAPSMTPSKDTSDYFESLNIPCIVKSDRLKRKHSELKPFHGQRFIVMDEPEGNGNDQVVLSIIQEMKNPYVL